MFDLMRLKAFQSILIFLALLDTVHASISPTAECTAQAWVRAPDLTPDTIIRGDTRVKISAGCPAVETVLLGLRFKERSVIKALYSEEDRQQLHSANMYLQQPFNLLPVSPWDFPLFRHPGYSDEVTSQQMLTNKDLWLVREEERLVFETTQVIHIAGGDSRDRDVVQDFAVLVPSTNFPPALDCMDCMPMVGSDSEIVNVESVYEYVIRVPFANGTTEEISAGFTSFQPLYGPAETLPRPSSEVIGLELMPSGKDSPVANYTAQVSGLVFTEGSKDQVVTVVITRTGPARTFAASLRVRGCVEPAFLSKWAVEYGIRSLQPLRRSGYVLRATPEDVEEAKRGRIPWSHCYYDAPISITMPNPTSDEIQSGTIVTTSAAVTIPVEVGRRRTTNFETYYQTLANSLRVILEIPPTEDESVDPNNLSAEVPYTQGPELWDDEEPWVPWEKPLVPWEKPASGTRPFMPWATYSGSVPAVVRSITYPARLQQCSLHTRGRADMSDSQVILSGETDCKQRPLIHYLDDGARGPMFVDHNTIHELLVEDPEERELRAPILEPIVSSPSEGDELVFRYYPIPDPRKPLIYVGETWVKKVVNRCEREVSSPMSGPCLIV